MLRHFGLALGLLILLALRATYAEPAPGGLVPANPRQTALGDSRVMGVGGFDALFGNPAGFQSPDGELTVLSVNPFLSVSPVSLIGSALDSALVEQAQESGGRFGVTLGSGYVGKGLGLGLLMTSEADVGPSPAGPGLSGIGSTTLQFVGGYSYTFEILSTRLYLGGVVRPMFRFESVLDDRRSRIALESLAEPWNLWAAIHPQTVFFGSALAFDLGLLVEAGRLNLGVLATDVGGTSFEYRSASSKQIRDSLALLRFVPEGDPSDRTHTIEMVLSGGLSYELSRTIEVVAEVHDIINLLQGDQEPLDAVHLGLDLMIGERTNLMLGLAGGLPTGGLFFDLPVLDVGLAYRHGGADGDHSPMISLETAIRF